MTASTAHISWHEPKDNGSPILGYWIERKEVNSKHWTRVNRALLNSLEVKVTGLMEGLTYIFRVCAENLAGPGPFSDPTDRIVAMDEIRECSTNRELQRESSHFLKCSIRFFGLICFFLVITPEMSKVISHILMTDKDVSKVVLQTLLNLQNLHRQEIILVFLIIKIMNDTFLINRKNCIYAAEGRT